MSSQKKDLIKRYYIKLKELDLLIFSFLIKSNFLNNKIRYIYFFNYTILNYKFFLKNHCLLTRNNLSINRFSYLSRSNFKNLINCGYINLIKKSSW